jgi:dolichol-phosphate mannosyltransferase
MTDARADIPQRRASDRPPVVSVITPTYCESANIEPLVAGLEAALSSIPHEIIVVDDDSPDLTWQVAEELALRVPSLRVVRRVGESGLSSAVMAGMAAATGAVLAVIDADLQHDESVLPQMVSLICAGDADVVVGTRAAEGGSYGDWGAGRRFVSWVATLIAKIFLRVPVSDPMSGFFAVSRGTYERYGSTINPQGFKILLEFVGRRHPGLRVREVGFTFRNRLHGETKLSPSVIRSYILAVVELRVGRQVKGQFVLYCLVGLSGVAVNLAVFEVFEHLSLGAIDLGFKNPVRWSLLAGIQASIVWNFLLNNYFTFWERRFHRRQLPWGFVLFEVVSLLGVFVHVAVFQFLELNHRGAGLLGATTLRLVHDAIGFTVALITNYFLNVNYVWSRRRAAN